MKSKILKTVQQGGTYYVLGRDKQGKLHQFWGYHMGRASGRELDSVHDFNAGADPERAKFENAPGDVRRMACKALGLPVPKKPKSCFTSKEIAHVWANEGAPEGKSPGNMSFDGMAFYSYGTCIARILHTKAGKRVYVLDSAGFSPSTSAHQGAVRGAIEQSAARFYVQGGHRGQGLRFTPKELRDHYLSGFKLTTPETHKLAHEKASALLTHYHALDEAIRVCEVFGLPKKKLVATRRRGKADVKEAREIWNLHLDKRDAKRKARDAKQQAQKLQNAIAYAANYLADSSLIRYDSFSRHLLSEHRPELFAEVEATIKERSAGIIKAWLAGETNEADYSWPLMLRREDNEVVSSQGARVPLADAERTYRFIEKVKARGWHANGEQHQVGAYALRHVRQDVVQIGCHTISLDECQRFAAEMGWTVSK